MKRNPARLFFLFTILLSLLTWAPPQPVHAASLVVNTLVDENDGSCIDGDCSLRDAIAVANDTDVITFSVTGIITLTGTQLEISKNIDITGPGSASLTVSGNNLSRIFKVNPTFTVSISGMTMTNGRPDPDDSASGCGGGAIYNLGFLTLNDVVLTNNSSPEDTTSPYTGCVYPRGGGIITWGYGSLTITNSAISNNQVYSYGGGIYFQSYEGTLTMTNVLVDGNISANYGGGGIHFEYGNSAATLTDITVSNNEATDSISGNGGGVYLGYSGFYTSVMNIYNSTISTNDARYGGGIYVHPNATLNLTNSTVAENSASIVGGGLFNENGTITINASTLKGNTVTGGVNSNGGGIYNLGNADTASITIVNSTLTNNSSTLGKGGAIFNQASGSTVNDIATVSVLNSTIVGNSANNNFGGGGIAASNASSVEISTITLSNSIVYGNTLTSGTNGENCVRINTGTIVVNNHNLFQNLPNDCAPGVNDVTSSLTTSEVVNVLASNGGVTQTMSLPNGSPAINAGSNAICAATPVSNNSQNGVTRPSDFICDIGSFEKPNLIPTTATFEDVPTSHPYFADIEILYANGLTAGCSTQSLLFCPDMTMNRAQSAVFMVRGNFGNAYSPPPAPWLTFGDDFSPGLWAQPWAQGMFDAGLTAGCSTTPRLFCPWEEMPRFQAAVFGLRLKYGDSYPPPAGTGTVFADLTDPTLWYAGWAEQAYNQGLLPACGSEGGKPLFCPNDLVPRGLAAYMIVRAKNLSMP